MTNEEKVEKYKEEVEAVFQLESAVKMLNRRDEILESGNVKDLEHFDMTAIGRYHKTYFIKVEVQEFNTLSSFFMKWMFSNLEIAGLRVTEISWDNLKSYDTQQLKNKLKESIDKMIEEL